LSHNLIFEKKTIHDKYCKHGKEGEKAGCPPPLLQQVKIYLDCIRVEKGHHQPLDGLKLMLMENLFIQKR
jgi:hypothetical protein